MVFVISLPTKLKNLLLLFAIYLLLIYIIYGDRTIIGFVGFVAMLLNRPTDGVRKRVTFRPPMSEITVFIKNA
jgi:hypothetical protein